MRSNPPEDTATVPGEEPRSLESAEAHPDDDYGRIRATLVRAVRRICPGWMRDRQEDLVQVALLRVLDVRRKAEGDRPFASSYFHKVAYSALVDELRRLKRRREVPMEDEAGPAPYAVAAPDPEHRAIASEVGRAIAKCLARLRRERRLAVTLHLQGHGVPEAARLLDWGLKRTENLIYRGLDDLRRCLALQGVAP